MTRDRRVRIASWAAAAVALCAALALRQAVSFRLLSALEPKFLLTTRETIIFQTSYYAMWAALVPAIFAFARRIPFRRGRWLSPAAFHIVTSVVVSGLSGVALGVLFGGFVRNDWPDPTGATIPSWLQLGAHRAVADMSMYWLVLATGFALQAYDENRERERQAADLEGALVTAQVDVLKMKLQPHFLFNTLNSVSFLAVERDTGGVVTMVERLSRLLRSSMQSDGSQVVTLEKELSLLDEYLAIEEIRFADRLCVVRCVDPAAMGALLPSLVLQPIIENSIKHGFSKRIDASRLEIGITRQSDTLVVRVEDDGPGLPPGWDLGTHCGRGLRNVIERLDKLFPGAWAFTLANRPTSGAIAELRIPWLHVEDVGRPRANQDPPAAEAGGERARALLMEEAARGR